MTIFKSARIRLTFWYVATIMMLSVIFSAAFYQSATREIQRLINRIEFEQELENNGVELRPQGNGPGARMMNTVSLSELKELKQRSLFTLGLLNGVIFLISIGAAHILAGRTLDPIQQMVNEQNNFISNASHELRTPLAILRAQIEASKLKNKFSQKDLSLLLKSNLEEVESLEALTDDLFQITQTHKNSQKNKFEVIKVSKIVNSSIGKVKSLAKKKQIKISKSVKDSKVKVIPNKIVQVLVILLDNAIKYSPEKSNVKVQVTSKLRNVEISISDNGPGISQEDLPHIFERFYRADKSRSDVEGFGLGLSIAKSIVNQHRGKLSVRNGKSSGSIFTIELTKA